MASELISDEDALAVKLVANAIGRRGVRLAGTAVGSVIIKSGIPRQASVESTTAPEPQSLIYLAIDGSVAGQYPGFENCMRSALRAAYQIGEHIECRISIGQAKDGSNVGAAIVALIVRDQQMTIRPTTVALNWLRYVAPGNKVQETKTRTLQSIAV